MKEKLSTVDSTPQPYLRSVLLDFMKVGETVYEKRVVKFAYYAEIAQMFSENLDTLLVDVPTEGGITLVWEETLGAHFDSGEYLKISELPDNFLIFDAFGKATYAKDLIEINNDYFGTASTKDASDTYGKRKHIFVHMVTTKGGQRTVENGVMPVSGITGNKLPENTFEGAWLGKDGDGNDIVLKGAYFCPDNGHFLESRLEYDVASKEFTDRGEDWYKQKLFNGKKDNIVEANIQDTEIPVLGKKVATKTLCYYRSDTKVTGNGFSAFLQEVDHTVVPTNPYKAPIDAIPSMKRVEIEDLNVKLNYLPSKETNAKIDALIAFLLQLGVTKYNYRGRTRDSKVSLYGRIAVCPEFLNLHNEGTELYSINNYRKLLRELEPQNGEDLYGKDWIGAITRFTMSGATPIISLQSKEDFYKSWAQLIQAYLNRDDKNRFGPKSGSHSDKFRARLLNIDPDQMTNNDFNAIDDALIEELGYIGFMCLLSGIMTFFITFPSISSSNKDFHVEFILHEYKVQSKLFQQFGITSLDIKKHKNFVGITPEYLGTIHNIDGSKYSGLIVTLTSLLLSGVKVDDQIKTPSISPFLNDYFNIYQPLEHSDYKEITKKFFIKDLGTLARDLNSKPKSSEKLKKWNFFGRRQIINLFVQKIENDPSLDGYMKPLAKKYVLQNVDNPSTDNPNIDIASQLRLILIKGKGQRIQIYAGKFYWVEYDELIDVLTPEMIITLLFKFRADRNMEKLFSIKNRAESAYFLDFDLTFDDKFKENLVNAYTIFSEMIESVAKDEDQVDLVFYIRRKDGKFHTNEINERDLFEEKKLSFVPSDPIAVRNNLFSMLLW